MMNGNVAKAITPHLLVVILLGIVSLTNVGVARAAEDGKASTAQALAQSPPSRGSMVRSGTVRVPDGAAADSGGASASNATNMGGDASFQVNPRTGGVSLEAELFSLNGINEDADLDFSLTYQSEDAVSDEEGSESVFGLPPGWSISLSYLENKDTYVSLNVDGNQQYVYDRNWTTVFKPAGASHTQIVLTGLKEYNRTDTNLQTDTGSVQVDGVSSAYKLSAMNGTTQYFSSAGLLLEKVDRFGNAIDFYYNNGKADPHLARLTKIVDSWGNEIVFNYCVNGSFPGGGSACESGDVQIDLPDGRTVGWRLAGNELRRIIDAQGKATVLNYSSVCGDTYDVLSAVTSPSGASSTIEYQCMNVCTRTTYPQACTTDYKQWPVAFNKYDCPSNPSGQPCREGSAADNLTTRFLIGGTDSTSALENYTGYPFYSPYDTYSPNQTPDPAADALMQSNDNAFEYVTTSQTVNGRGLPVLGEESHYDFLHLEMETIHYVRDAQGNFPVVAKRTSNCFDLTGNGPQPGCPMSVAPDYTELPANYQSPVMTGSCVYAVAGQPSSGSRLSIVRMDYDSFGNMIRRRAYQGTKQSGLVSNCNSRPARMDPSNLNMVIDSHLQYDTPSTVQNQFLVMGKGSKHYGLLSDALSFLYEDPDDGAAAPSATPLSVTLSCNTFTADSGDETEGTAVKTNLFGEMPLDTPVPDASGVVDACGSPDWDESVAPPKLTTYGYDAAGRVISVLGKWAGKTGQQGIASTQSSNRYELTSGTSGEEPCSRVLQKTMTDANGYQSVSRICTENSFPLSSADEEGRTVSYRHDLVGLATSVIQPNGTSQQYEYYYACPIAQDGVTPTCPADNTANGNCPYGDQGLGRSCVVSTMVAGANPNSGKANQSYADGVMTVMINDGAGRAIETMDNVGAGATGSGYNVLQSRSRAIYSDLGLLLSQSSSIGTEAPLIYTASTTYGPKLRPQMACDAWGNSHQFVHDDVGQNVKRLMNGHQLNRISMDDSNKLTAIEDCPVGENESLGAGSGACPTVGTDTENAECSGNVYLTQIKRDGAGNQRGVTVSDPEAASTGASIASISASVVYDAELHKHGLNLESTAVGSGQSLTASGNWLRDLNGLSLDHSLTVTTGASEQSTSASSTFAFDELGNNTSETNPLGSVLTMTNTFTPTRKLSTQTDYAGTMFHSYYDDMDWMARHCYPAEGGGSQGEITTHDPLTAKVLSISHFTNPAPCSKCSDGNCGDVVDSSITYTYTRFDAIASKTYSEDLNTSQPRVTVLEWAYDKYQRPVCFADATATRAGFHCPPSPVADDFQPDPSEQLTRVTYWPDDDPYRRGMPKSSCRGIPQQEGGNLVYVDDCVESDYYTAMDTDGACNGGPGGAGAYAGLIKTKTMCLGGTCDAGGSLVYQTTYQYDPHRRACSVQTLDPAGQAILASSYVYDQYENVINETHSSDLDSSTKSNYRIDYAYDGLLRLISETRTDTEGALIERTTYAYDARSNLIEKVQQRPITSPGPLPTPTAPAALTPTASALPTATAGSSGNDDSCAIQPRGGGSCVLLLLPGLLLLFRRRREGRP